MVTNLNEVIAVTNSFARIPRVGFENQAPRNAVEFADRFLKSSAGFDNRADMDSYKQDFVDNKERSISYAGSAQAERSPAQCKGSPYTMSIFKQGAGLVSRRMQIVRGNWAQEAVQIV